CLHVPWRVGGVKSAGPLTVPPPPPVPRSPFTPRRLSAALAAVLFVLPAPAQEKAKPVSFINDVAPILKENCYACHDAKKRSGKFEMTNYETFRKGGSNDDPVEPGTPAKSLIVKLLTTTGEKRMPPKDKAGAFAKEQVDVIEQ